MTAILLLKIAQKNLPIEAIEDTMQQRVAQNVQVLAQYLPPEAVEVGVAVAQDVGFSQSVSGNISDVSSSIYGAVQNVVSPIVGAVSEVESAAMGIIGEVESTVLGVANEAESMAMEVANEVASAVLAPVNEAVGTVADMVNDAISGTVSSVRNVESEVLGVVNEAAYDAQQAELKVSRQVSDMASSVFKAKDNGR